ncbi:GGDEF domain-containing protein [Dyella sp. C9]|uniref:GGDEF domain-containing protein n=1 Tax=Dyella sp. C9 TaxID=2202154 RepID=UPI000DEECF6F|nr:GGDEF domain-containing protein [Dyella sp. C9]
MATPPPRSRSIDWQFKRLVITCCLALLPFAAWALFHQWMAYQEARSATADLRRFHIALIVMEDLSNERIETARRFTSQASGEPAEPLPLQRLRGELDAQLGLLGQSVTATNCSDCASLQRRLHSTEAALAQARTNVDALLARGADATTCEAASNVMDQLFAITSQLSSLAAATVAPSVQHNPDTVRYAYVASFASLLRDYAGQMGSEVSMGLSQACPLTRAESLRIEQLAGKIRLLYWLSGTVVRARPLLDGELIARIDQEYMKKGLDYTRRVASDHLAGRTDVSPLEFRRSYTGFMAPIVELRNVALDLAATSLRHDQRQQGALVIVLVGGLLLLAALLLLVTRRFHEKIVRPFIMANDAVLDIAADRDPGDLKHASFHGEIGDLFSALGMLWSGNKRRLELEQERERLMAELKRMAETDHLTGLLNRRAFEHEVLALLGDRRSSDAWIVLTSFDVDHFKHINDTYGHEAGDLALQKLAELCRETWRSGDVVGRVGGEEFVALSVVDDPAQATAAAQRLMERLHQTSIKLPNGATFRMTVSFGVVFARRAGVPTLAALNRQADALLYQAKSSGRDRLESARFSIET